MPKLNEASIITKTQPLGSTAHHVFCRSLKISNSIAAYRLRVAQGSHFVQNLAITSAKGEGFEPKMTSKAVQAGKVVVTRRQVEGLIAEGRIVVIVDGMVLKLDSWTKYHPGGDKAILHMVGKDATDEVNA